jgi:hypothetical protein
MSTPQTPKVAVDSSHHSASPQEEFVDTDQTHELTALYYT